MGSIPTPNTVCAHVRGTNAGQYVENTFYYEFGSAPAQGDIDSLAVALGGAVLANWLPILPSSYVGREVFVEDLTDGSALMAIDTQIFGEPGTYASDPLPNNVSLSIARKSTLSGRNNRGRIFWPAIAAGYLASQNVVDSATATSILTAIASLDSEATDLDWTPVIVSLFLDGVARAAGVTVPISIWQVVDLVLDSRQRRLPGRGV